MTNDIQGISLPFRPLYLYLSCPVLTTRTGHGLMTHPVRCWFPLFLAQSLSIIQTRNKCDFRSFSFFFSKERTSSITCDKYRKRGRRLPLCPGDEMGRKLRWFITVWVRLLVSGEWEVEDEKWKVLCYFDVYLYPPWFRMVTRTIKETATRGTVRESRRRRKGALIDDDSADQLWATWDHPLFVLKTLFTATMTINESGRPGRQGLLLSETLMCCGGQWINILTRPCMWTCGLEQEKTFNSTIHFD